MKLLLIRPPLTNREGSAGYALELPLGMLYIAAVIEKHRTDVTLKVLDSAMGNTAVPDEDGNPIIGISWEEIEDKIKEFGPDMVGISNMFTTQYPNAVKVAQIAKKLNPSIKVVVGGPHVTVKGEESLKETPEIDVVALGEGELTALELIDWAEGKKGLSEVEGIGYRDGDVIKLTARRTFITDLDEIPFPAYHLISMEEYVSKGLFYGTGSRIERLLKFWEKKRPATMITSRGCPYHCTFCSIFLHMGRTWRPHSSQYVLSHIKTLVEKYDINHIHFIDDNLAQGRERFEEIIDGIIAIRKSGKKLTWDTPNGVRVDRLTDNIIRKAKISGCRYIYLSVESGDQEVLDRIIRKKLSLEKVLEAAESCHRHGLKASAGFVMGMPGETVDSFKKTIEFAEILKNKYGINCYVSTATPFFATELYNISKEKGYLIKPVTPETLSTSLQGAGLITTEDFTEADVREYRKQFELRGLTLKEKIIKGKGGYPLDASDHYI